MSVEVLYIPKGKVLEALNGNYVFVGPTHAYLDGKIKIPDHYTDGTPVKGAKNDNGNVTLSTKERTSQRTENKESSGGVEGRDENTEPATSVESPLRKPKRQSDAVKED